MPVHDRGRGLCPVLLGIGLGWGAGNIGPVAAALAHDFRVPLATIGLLSGTAYFGAILAATLLSVPLAARAGVVRAAAAAIVVMAAGQAVFAVSPVFAGLLIARVLVGAGTGLGLVAGPVLARELGGVRLLGLFGGGVTAGIAAALGLGSVLADMGTNWRIGFVISAAVCAAPLLVLPPPVAARPEARPGHAFIAAALRTGAVWRLLSVFVAANGVSLVVGAWLVTYLTKDVHLRPAVAGGLAFCQFAVTALMRPVGARMAVGRRAFPMLAGGGLLIAAAGLGWLAAARSLPYSVLAVLLMGAGFALPYAVMIDAAGRMFAGQAAATLALVQTGPNLVPMLVIPLVGTAFDTGHAALAFLALAVFVAVSGLISVLRG